MPNATMPCPTSRIQGGMAAKFAQPVILIPYAFIGNIRVTNVAAGTPVQFDINSSPCDFCLIGGETNNAGVCFVGAQNVRGTLNNENGLPIVAGANNPIGIYVNDLNMLWMDATTSGDEVLVTYFRY